MSPAFAMAGLEDLNLHVNPTTAADGFCSVAVAGLPGSVDLAPRAARWTSEPSPRGTAPGSRS